MGSGGCCSEICSKKRRVTHINDKNDVKDKSQIHGGNIKENVESKCRPNLNNNKFIKEKDNNNNNNYNSKYYNENEIIRGFDNIGNTCYINSFLQILFHCPEFVRYLKKLENKFKKESLINAVIKLYKTYNSDYIEKIREIMEFSYNDFKKNVQCDSQYFGKKLIDKINQEIKGEDINSSLSYSEKDMTVEFQILLNNYLSGETDFEKIFTLIDAKITENNIIFNSSLDIEVSIPKNNEGKKIFLEDLIDKEYNNLKKPQKKICRMPKILIITINRATINELYNTKKIYFPETLEFKNYINKKI